MFECTGQIFVTPGATVMFSLWDPVHETNVANEGLRGLISPKAGFPAF